MRGGGVVEGEHGDRAQPELASGPDEPDGDLAPVGDEQGHETSRERISWVTSRSGVSEPSGRYQTAGPKRTLPVVCDLSVHTDA
ncbi:hypothetical protein GCM10023175_38490 [Pseudonocardia xishanensis]|uniref:Uncharacterized protein n=1 Tax=Pseudonocardia xishanensis TaxID=630995 RepID=A0ABP8RVI0_9PSEU